jgi:predicted dehydrogenase/threonine dehydrogenase-like Zn-dependent dehydrogenase
VELPAAGRGEVSVEVLSSVISPGTERAQYLRLPSAAVSFPYRPGYSAAGVVISVGPGVSHVERGDAVAVSGAPHASITTVPSQYVYRVPPGVGIADASLVHLGIICGQGVRRAGPVAEESVCVVGAGLIGSLAQRIAVAAGATGVTVVARSRSKEQVVRAGGADELLVVGEDDDRIAALFSSVVIEATGDPDGLHVAVAAAAAGGRVVLLGSPRGNTPDLRAGRLREKRLTLVGAHVNNLVAEGRLTGVDMRRREAERFLELVADGRLRVADLVDKVVDPREAGGFYRELATSRTVIGARFDWTLLSDKERRDQGHFWRLPDLSGRGVEAEGEPLPSSRNGRRRRRLAASPDDPFEGAAGRLRFGLLGCGDIAVGNAAALAAAPNTELVACFDPVAALAEELAGTYGADTAPTAEALLARGDVDAVFLSVPHHLHAPLALEAAAHGRHIVVEKPLSNTLESAQEIVDAVKRAGVELSVCFPHRYQPEVVAARRRIDEGALGEFAGAHLALFDDKPPSYWVGGPSGRSQSDWRASREKAGGGTLIMNLPHYIDLLRHLVGADPEDVAATTSSEAGAEVEDTVSMTLRYRNGALASLVCCTAMRGARSIELRLWGRDGQIKLEPAGRIYTLRAMDGLRTSRWQPLGSPPSTAIRAAYVSRFATALAEGRPPEVTAADGLAVQAVMEASYRSSETGRRVRPADVLEEARTRST